MTLPKNVRSVGPAKAGHYRWDLPVRGCTKGGDVENVGGYALMQFERLFHLAAPPFQLRLPRARTFEGGVLPAVDQADATAR